MYILCVILDDVSAYCLLSLGEVPFEKGTSPRPLLRKLSQIGFYMVVCLRMEVGFVLVDWTTGARRLMGPRSPTGGFAGGKVFESLVY